VSGFRCQRRPDETIGDAATRCATDAVYHERDRGGDMHTAGELAADAVLGLVVEWLAKDVNPRVAFRLLRALGHNIPETHQELQGGEQFDAAVRELGVVPLLEGGERL
jgi:hypothetical protein